MPIHRLPSRAPQSRHDEWLRQSVRHGFDGRWLASVEPPDIEELVNWFGVWDSAREWKEWSTHPPGEGAAHCRARFTNWEG